MKNLTPREIMAIMAARELRGYRTVLVGVGLPNLSANLAKKIYNPDMVLLYESGVINTHPTRLPLSIGDPTLTEWTDAIFSVFDMFAFMISGNRVDVGFLGAAQVDVSGNINTTVIGSYKNPDVRLPGSGGACEISYSAAVSIVMTELSESKFRTAVDFITSTARHGQMAENVKERGVLKLITDLGIVEFGASGSTRVGCIYDISGLGRLRDVFNRLGLALDDDVSVAESIEDDEILALRQLDPDHLYIN